MKQLKVPSVHDHQCSSFFREEFTYDNGSKTGPAVLKGVAGAVRKGQKKNGQWHGTATYTTQVGRRSLA